MIPFSAYPMFQIANIETDGSVDGRNCGTDLTLSTVFTRIIRQDFMKAPTHEFCPTEVVLADSLLIRIESITVYGRSWEELSSGMTARLRLSGRGSEDLMKQFDELGDHSYIALDSPL